MPDAVDLRIVDPIITHRVVPLLAAAQAAGISQTEAAIRMVAMAERGMPLRLVAEGDPNLLWQIGHAGPQGAPAQASDHDAPAQATTESPQQAHAEQDEGQQPALDQDAPQQAHAEQEAAVQEEAAPRGPVYQLSPQVWPGTAADAPTAAVEQRPQALDWGAQSVAGPSGEQLRVAILQVVDPANELVTAAGIQVPLGHRAVLIHSTVANDGPAYYPATGDTNLVVETADRTLLGQSGMSLPDHRRFGNGLPPHEVADGWTLFFVPQIATLTGIKWCIRPQFPETIVGWPIALPQAPGSPDA